MMFMTGFSLKPKFCINCKYYIQDDKNKLEYGKCSLFKYIIDKNDETLREICNRFNVNIKFDPK